MFVWITLKIIKLEISPNETDFLFCGAYLPIDIEIFKKENYDMDTYILKA